MVTLVLEIKYTNVLQGSKQVILFARRDLIAVQTRRLQ